MITFSIIIPIHNEAEHLKLFIENFISEIPKSLRPHISEIILVENGSTDASLKICQTLTENHSNWIQVLHLPQGNYGAAIKTGMLQATASHVIILECDYLDISFIKTSLEHLQQNVDQIIVASKRHPESLDQRPFKRRMLTFLFNKLLNWFLRYPGTDTHGLKALPTVLAKQLCNLAISSGEVFQTEIVLIAWKLKHPIFEVPISIQEQRISPVKVIRRLPKILNLLQLLRKSIKRFT